MVPVALLLLARGAAAAPELPSFVRLFRYFQRCSASLPASAAPLCPFCSAPLHRT